MPLAPQRLDNGIRNWLSATFTLRTEAVGVTVDTPRISFFLHERGGGVKGVTALRAEKVTSVPFCTARDDDFTLDGRLTRLAAGGEALVEIEVAVEARRFIEAVLVGELGHEFRGFPAREEGNVGAGLAGANAVYACGVFERGFGVEGNAFEFLTALVACEALGVKAASGGGHNSASDRERAVSALSAGTDGGWSPVCAGGIGRGPGRNVSYARTTGGKRLLGKVTRVWKWSCRLARATHVN
jgi:hypothetical protein